MVGSAQQWWMIAPLLVWSSFACAQPAHIADTDTNPFDFEPNDLESIRFTRSETEESITPGLGSNLPIDRRVDYLDITRQTEFSFKLKPKMPDFSRDGSYGFDLFEAPKLDIQSSLVGVDGLIPSVSLLHDGLEYSAGVRMEHEDAQIDGTAYVSSSLLGLSYGRLGRVWYGAIDVNLEQFSSSKFGSDASDVLSLDVTTGRRFGLTGLDANSPLWLLSVQGNLDMNEWEVNEDLEASSAWSINPSLFWQQPGFTLSAQMHVPLEFQTLDDEGEPDYRLRAVFEKQFK